MKQLDDIYSHFAQIEIVGDRNSSGNGIQLAPSTGADAVTITAVGDNANVPITLAGAGTGAVQLGNSSSLPQVYQNAAVGSTASVAGLGNIGGASGPTSTAQVGWIKILESSGGGAFIPYWK